MVVESKLMLEVKAILKSFGNKYFNGDKLKRHKVIEDLNAYDEKLIQSLLNNKTINRDFVILVNGKELFKLNEFIDIFQYKEFWQDSYTNYANKIGLTVGGKFIDECEDVVLDFPYKDTVLKAGMTKEDKQKEDLAPNEIFLNEIIAKDEIDVLFDKKIFKNVKRYSAEGVQPISEFKEDDNLIIKGNNLIALHSLRDKYAKRIKLIYIDPPYNTDNDSFNYNDKFTRSTWLTFLKNRLEVAKQLLTEDGTIWVTLSDVQAHYFKVLADEIFDEENFLGDVIWQSRKSVSNDTFISLSTNHVFVYAKNKSILDKNKFRLKMDTNKFKYDNNDGKGLYRCDPFDAPEERKNLCYEIVNPNTGTVYKPAPGRHWSTTEDEYKRLYSDGRIAFGTKGTSKPQLKVYLEEEMKKGKGVTPTTLWNDINTTTNATKNLEKLFGSKMFKNPKPEELIERILEIASNENDIILDFFLGSGTTCAVAHKMKRRFIGIEQMDYINTISVPRLQKVIEGEQGGISKDVNWQGGGSFVYAELFEKNTGFIKDILNAETIDDLKKVYNIMLEVGDLDFRADLSKINWTMSFEDNQKLLIKIIDKNQLYFNYSEIDDSEVSEWLTNEEIAFNKNFYENLEG